HAAGVALGRRGAGVHAGVGGDDGVAGIGDGGIFALVVAADQDFAARAVGVVHAELAILAHVAACGGEDDATALVFHAAGADHPALVDRQGVEVAVGGLHARLRGFDQAAVVHTGGGGCVAFAEADQQGRGIGRGEEDFLP